MWLVVFFRAAEKISSGALRSCIGIAYPTRPVWSTGIFKSFFVPRRPNRRDKFQMDTRVARLRRNIALFSSLYFIVKKKKNLCRYSITSFYTGGWKKLLQRLSNGCGRHEKFDVRAPKYTV